MSTRYFLGLVALFFSLPTFAQSFPDQCNGSPLPFSSIEVKHPIDASCGISGRTTSPQNSQTQNRVKNNFCSTGTPEAMTPDDLIALQKKTTVPSGTGKEPADRTPLQQMGEGKLIRVKAFLIEAHHADLGGGESVNCNGATEELNDIHMAMGTAADTQECGSISAEISPHYRPASWNEIGHFELYNSSTRKYAPNPAVDARLQAQPYRITGQLFFDSSHSVCPCGTTCSPTRSSLWEIHPVYAIEVCKSGTSCDAADDSNWIAFDTWWNGMPPIKKPKPPHTHQPHEPSSHRTTTTSPSGSD